MLQKIEKKQWVQWNSNIGIKLEQSIKRKMGK